MTFEWELERRFREGQAAERASIINKLLEKLSVEEVIELGFSEEDIAKAQAAEE